MLKQCILFIIFQTVFHLSYRCDFQRGFQFQSREHRAIVSMMYRDAEGAGVDSTCWVRKTKNICSICNFHLTRPVLLFLDECISFGYFSLECDEPWSMGKIPLESCLQRKGNTKSQSSSKPRLELATGSQENLNHLQSKWAQFHMIPIYFFIMAPFHPEVDDRHIGSKDRACSASDPPRAPLPGGQ